MTFQLLKKQKLYLNVLPYRTVVGRLRIALFPCRVSKLMLIFRFWDLNARNESCSYNLSILKTLTGCQEHFPGKLLTVSKNKVSCLIARVLGKFIRSTRYDSMMVLGISQTYPLQFESESNVRQVNHTTIVVLASSSDENVKISFKYDFP